MTMRMTKVVMVLVAVVWTMMPCYGQKREKGSDFNLRKAEEVLNESGDTKEALRLLDLQLKEVPDDVRALVLRTTIRYNEKEYGHALDEVNRAIRAFRKRGEVDSYTLYWWRALIYLNLNEYDKAIADFERSSKEAKKQDPGRLNNILFDLAQLYYEREQWDRSDEYCRQMLKNEETDVRALVLQARLSMEQAKLDEALALLDRCELYNSDYSELYYYRMQVYDRMGEEKKAVMDALMYYDLEEEPDWDLLEKILLKKSAYSLAECKYRYRTYDDPEEWLMLEIFMSDCLKDRKAELECLNRREELLGQSTELYVLRADCYSYLGDYANAIDQISRAIEMDRDPDGYYYLTRAFNYRKMGEYDKAIADCTKCLEYAPMMVTPYYMRGWCYELKGDDDKAMADYNLGIEIGDYYPYIFLMRAEQYEKHGDIEKARADYEQVVAKDTVARTGSCRQYALAALGQEKEALDWMEQIIAQDSLESGNYYDMSCLLGRMGRKEMSLRALEVALQKGYREFMHIAHDDDMDPIRDMPEFHALIEKYDVPAEAPDLTEEEKVGETEGDISEVPMKRMGGGIYEIDCCVNELPLKFIFDTGASSVTLSLVEANFMYKNGYLSKEDVRGKKLFMDANGDISEGTVINLREIKLGDVLLTNVEASVTKGQRAPLLLGQSVMERFGILTIDNINSKLVIKKK